MKGDTEKAQKCRGKGDRVQEKEEDRNPDREKTPKKMGQTPGEKGPDPEGGQRPRERERP